MRRVVVTGMGIQSCIGTDLPTVKESLYHTTSGIKANPEYTERVAQPGVGIVGIGQGPYRS